ncbi:MAG: SipW-dependent-type signal peptide-containing protein [Clostridia bacterium]|nr:SipW-dependent-type signal peptide-containing protein [Clostridia bacterium]
MKKSTLLMVLSLVLAIALGVGSTLAYLTDTDADKNVMTVGRVSIVQNEQQRVEQDGQFTDTLEPFEDNKMVLPYTPREGDADKVTVGDHELELSDTKNNYIDKIVSVTNTSNVDVYVRTLVAVPTGGSAWEPTPAADADSWLHWETPQGGDDHWTLNTTPVDIITVDEVNYYVWEFVHKEAVAPQEITYPVIRGLYMDSKVDMDDKGYYIADANGNTKRIEDFLDAEGKLNVLVLSQAVQADGFADPTTAMTQAFPYGDDAANVEKWFTGWTADDIGSPGDKNDTNDPPILVGDDPSVTYEVPADAFRVTNAAGLQQAVADGKTTLLLAAGEYDIVGCQGKTLTLIGEDHENTVITVVGAGQGEANGQLDYDFDGSNVTFQNLTIKTNNMTYAGYARMNGVYKNVNFVNTYCLNGTSEFEYCTFDIAGDQYNIWTWGAPKANFAYCTFNSDGKAVLLYGTANTKLTLESCLFNDTGVLPDLKAAVEIGNDYNTSYELIVNNTVVNGYEENDKGILTGSTLWANKNSMSSDKLNVVVDGVDIY